MGDILKYTATLREDDLNDNTNPVTVVPGVAGKIIVPIKSCAVFFFIDNKYSTGTGAQFDASIGSTTVGQPFFYIQGFTDSAANQFQTQPLNDNIAAISDSMVGADMVCAATGVITEDVPGSSYVEVTTAYYLVDGPLPL